MVDIGKLTPEQAKLFNDIKAGGLNPEELKALEKAGVAKELLEVMKTEFPDTGEIPKGEPKDPQNQGGNFWGALGVVAACAAAGFIAGNVFGAAVGAVAGIAMVSFSSCSVEQDVGIKIEKDDSNQEIIDKLNQIGYTLEQVLQQLVTIGKDMNDIVEILRGIGQDTNRIVELLLEQNKASEQAKAELEGLLKEIISRIDTNNKLSVENNALLKQILAKINTQGDDEAGIALLKEILAKLTESVEQNKEMDQKTHKLLQSILENIENLNGDMKTGFANIVDLIVAGNKIGESTLAKLEEVLAKLGKMDANQQAGFAAVLNALEGLGAQADAILDAILNGDKLTQEQLDVIINNQNIQNANFEKLIELVMKNNEIAQGTQNAVKDLSTKMSEEHKAILDKISKGNATLGDIQVILEAIKGDTSKIGDIKQFMNIIGTALEKLLEEVQGLRAETKQGLLAILAKIPDGCKCKPADLSDLLAKLEIIIQELQSDPNDDVDNPKHEGVLDDLDDFFG